MKVISPIGKRSIQSGLKKGIFMKDDGSVWVDLTDDGLDEKIPCVRTVWQSTTQDIGTAIQRHDDFLSHGLHGR